MNFKTSFVWLVVSTHLKNISQNGNHPPNRDENKKRFKPPPSCPLFAQTPRHFSNNVSMINTPLPVVYCTKWGSCIILALPASLVGQTSSVMPFDGWILTPMVTNPQTHDVNVSHLGLPNLPISSFCLISTYSICLGNIWKHEFLLFLPVSPHVPQV